MQAIYAILYTAERGDTWCCGERWMKHTQAIHIHQTCAVSFAVSSPAQSTLTLVATACRSDLELRVKSRNIYLKMTLRLFFFFFSVKDLYNIHTILKNDTKIC